MKPNELLSIIEKDLPRKAGIYMILCIPTNKAYIGQSKNIDRRWKFHRNDLKANRHGNEYLQYSYNKYGKEAFHFSVLEVCENRSEREAHYLNLIDKELRFNLAGISALSPMSEETRQKIRLKSKMSPQCLEAARIACTGKPKSEETKRKISETKKGKTSNRKGVKLSEESKKRMSESAKKRFLG